MALRVSTAALPVRDSSPAFQSALNALIEAVKAPKVPGKSIDLTANENHVIEFAPFWHLPQPKPPFLPSFLHFETLASKKKIVQLIDPSKPFCSGWIFRFSF